MTYSNTLPDSSVFTEHPPKQIEIEGVKRRVRHPNRPDRVNRRLPLRGQNLNLAQLRDNLLRLVNLPRYNPPPKQNYLYGRLSRCKQILICPA